jgi:hypothetical protein
MRYKMTSQVMSVKRNVDFKVAADCQSLTGV